MTMPADFFLKKSKSIHCPTSLCAYFDRQDSQNHVWAAFDGSVMVGWHQDYLIAQTAFKGLRLEKVYNSI